MGQKHDRVVSVWIDVRLPGRNLFDRSLKNLCVIKTPSGTVKHVLGDQNLAPIHAAGC